MALWGLYRGRLVGRWVDGLLNAIRHGLAARDDAMTDKSSMVIAVRPIGALPGSVLSDRVTRARSWPVGGPDGRC